MAIWYVDSSVATSGNGQSWATAWKAITNIAGLAAGDLVYFSGGPSGGAGQSYPVPSAGWIPASGTAGNPITYKIGQDSAHNGLATFVHANGFVKGCDNVVLSGDAGDGQMHFVLQPGGGWYAFDLGGHANVRASYINGQQGVRTFYYGPGNTPQPTQGMEVDHCYYYKLTHIDDDVVLYLVTGGSQHPSFQPGFDNCRIHHNEFHAPYSPTIFPDGTGDDFCSGQDWSGVSVYNNRFIAYPVANYLAAQHQDGSQPLGATNLKWYNNYAEDVTNYPFYLDMVYGGAVNVYVFNNIVCLTRAAVQSGNSPRGFVIGAEAAAPMPFRGVVVAHNIILDYGQHYATAVGDSGSNGTNTWGPGNGIWNNIATNNNVLSGSGHPTFSDLGNPNIANANNVNFETMPTGAGVFVAYTQNRGDIANLHLVSTATSLIAQGTNLSANAANCPEIMFDRDGVARPASGPWDIGPYQFVGGPPKISIGLAIGSSVQGSLKTIRRARANLK